MEKKRLSTAFRPEVNGLRAVAVILVIIFHLDESWMPFGYVGVDMFFVISGFLITRIIKADIEAGTFSYRSFVVRRVKRILPALFVVLLVSALLVVFLLSSGEYRAYFRSLRYASLQASNFHFASHSGYFDLASRSQVLLHTWSLAVEEQFYLVWPLLLCFVRRRLAKCLFIVAVIGLSFVGMLYLKRVESMDAFYMFYARAWEFGVGAVFALGVIPTCGKAWVRRVISVLSVACLVLALWLTDVGSRHEVWSMLVVCLSVGGVIYSSGDGRGWVERVLSLPPLLYIGVLSYSLYLWHWPVIVLYSYVKGFVNQGEVSGLGWCEAALLVMVCWVLSELTHRLVEKRFRYSRMGEVKTLVVAVLVMVVFAGGARFFQEFSKSSWRVSSFAEGVNLENFEIDKPERSYVRGDVIEDVLLVGDSHAGHFAPMIEAWAVRHGLRVKTFSKGGTPPVIVNDKYKSELPHREVLHLDRVREYIEAVPEVRYVFLACSHDTYQSDPRYEAALGDTVSFLEGLGKKVCLMGQVPPLKGEGIRYLEPTHLVKRWFSAEEAGDEERAKVLEYDRAHVEEKLGPMRIVMKRLQEKHPELRIWSPEEYIESGIYDGIPYYSDNNHLNIRGSMHFLPYFKCGFDGL